MNKSIGVKSSFTLVELIIVVLLISIVYFLLFANININSKKEFKVEIKTLKELMLKNFKFNQELALECIDYEGLNCFVFIDGKLNEDIKIQNIFEQKPVVYNYDPTLSDFKFGRVRIDNHDYEPFFELKINRDNKHKNIVLDTLDGRVYLFSSITKTVKVFNNTNEILDMMSDSSIEVKDAF